MRWVICAVMMLVAGPQAARGQASVTASATIVEPVAPAAVEVEVRLRGGRLEVEEKSPSAVRGTLLLERLQVETPEAAGEAKVETGAEVVVTRVITVNA
jgi:hypothetical protein